MTKEEYYKCKKCEEGILQLDKDFCFSYDSYPPQYDHTCDKCGYSQPKSLWSERNRLMEIKDNRELMRKAKVANNGVCRVCGAIDCHTRSYNNPTMECIKYLREVIDERDSSIDKLEARVESSCC